MFTRQASRTVLGRQLKTARGLSSLSPAAMFSQGGSSTLKNNKRLLTGLAAVAGVGLAQYKFGNANDFFEYKFKTEKKPEDLADFYGTEDFMEVFCVFPFMVNFMMRTAEFDDTGNIHAWGLLGPGQMEVSIDFDEKEEDLDNDGEPDTITWFNKRETFRDVAPFFGSTLWEMTQNFGYRYTQDGKCEVYHHGEHFHGPFPLRFLFHLHAKYVIWATQRYVNSSDFGTEDRAEEAEVFRHNIPAHEFNAFLESLAKQLEVAKDSSKNDQKRREEIEVTIQRLQTIRTQDQSLANPRLRRLQSHRTNVSTVHLVIDDKETKETIQTAMEQIGSSKDEFERGQQRQAPVAVMRSLTRRVTKSSQE